MDARVFVSDHCDRFFESFRVVVLGMMTLSNRRDLKTSPYGVNGSLGLFAILRG